MNCELASEAKDRRATRAMAFIVGCGESGRRREVGREIELYEECVQPMSLGAKIWRQKVIKLAPFSLQILQCRRMLRKTR